MQISTNYRYERATGYVTKAQDSLSTAQAQLATGKRLLAPSDDPARAMRIENIRGAAERQESFRADLQLIQYRYETEESAVRGVLESMTRFKELFLQATSDTAGTVDRQAIATELRQVRAQVVELMNAQDRDRQYIFSGTRVRAATYQEQGGAMVYAGDQTPVYVTTGDQRLQQFNRSGPDVFGRVVRSAGAEDQRAVGVFEVLDDAIAAIESSDRDGLEQGLDEIDQVYGRATLSLADIGGMQKNVEMQLDVVDETLLRLKTLQSEQEDLDYAVAVAELSKRSVALEAAMSSFAKIAALNLFDYLGR